jgi:DNA-binding GntR family transcriptional regulator
MDRRQIRGEQAGGEQVVGERAGDADVPAGARPAGTKSGPTATKPTGTATGARRPVTRPIETKPTGTKPTGTKPTVTATGARPPVTSRIGAKPTDAKPTGTKPPVTVAGAQPTGAKPARTKPAGTGPGADRSHEPKAVQAGGGEEPAPQSRAVRKGLGHRTIAAAATAEIRRRILEGGYAAGAPLRQDALADEFGVSRIPVREALLQLEAEGLVRILPHRGAVVSELSVPEVEEVFELRALLEPRLLRHSAPRLTEGDFKAMRALLAEYGTELASGQAGRWGELNTAFHLRLYQRAERPRSFALVSNLLREAERHTRMQLSFTDGRARAQEEHAALLDLCEAGRIREACTLLRAHVEHAGDALVRFIAARRPESGAA